MNSSRAPSSGQPSFDTGSMDSHQTKARVRNKAKTREELVQAIQEVKNTGLKMSVTAVALEAGVDASLIHHVYPDVAEAIRALVGRSTRHQRDLKHAELVDAKRTIRD